ncbi:MAG: sulfatase-like hydrolase/transferase [Myxococcota bacterium]
MASSSSLLGSGPEYQPAVLLVTLDTVRADHTGPYGYADAVTPTLDVLAASGTTWMRAYATTPLSIPSHASIHTGLYPPTHGVRNEGDFALANSHVTLAERFAEAGYRTMAFTSSFTMQRRWGLAQGFDLYHDPIVSGNPTQITWRDQRPADAVVDDALATLDALPDDGPVFLWVHLFDAHWPYRAPEPFASELENPYDAEIAFVDQQLRRLLDAWDARYWADASIVAVTSPHGESLEQGGEATHGFLLHDGSLRVPLIMRGPGVPAGYQVGSVVSHVDLAPTLLSMAGLPLHDGLQGNDLRDGGSEAAYHESLAGQFALGLAPLYGLTDDAGRYIDGQWGSYGAASGYEIRRTEMAPEGHRLDRPLNRMRRRLPETLAPEVSLDAQTLAMLSSLGYLAAGDPAASDGRDDPRTLMEHIPLTWRARERMGAGLLLQAQALVNQLEAQLPGAFGVELLQAQIHRRQGRLAQARADFVALYQRAPSSTLALQIAGVGTARGDWEDAAFWFDEAFHQQPSPEAMAGQVRVATMLGEEELADDRTFEFMVRFPDHPELALVRADRLLKEGQLTAALEEAQLGLQGVPWSPWAHQIMGDVLWALGRPDTAIAEMEEAIRLDPWQAGVRVRLARALLELDRNHEAVRVIGPVARHAPEGSEIHTLFAEARDAITDKARHALRRSRARGLAGRQ